MVDRINANRKSSMNYVTAGSLGTDIGYTDCTGLASYQLDLCEWNNELTGAAEQAGGAKSGAMIGARGCVTNTVPTMPRQFVVSVVWQGMAGTAVPSTDCGRGQYGNDATRRALTATVVIGCLQNTAPGAAACVTP